MRSCIPSVIISSAPQQWLPPHRFTACKERCVDWRQDCSCTHTSDGREMLTRADAVIVCVCVWAAKVNHSRPVWDEAGCCGVTPKSCERTRRTTRQALRKRQQLCKRTAVWKCTEHDGIGFGFWPPVALCKTRGRVMAGSKNRRKKRWEENATNMWRRGRGGGFELEQGVRVCFFQPNLSCCKLELVRCLVTLECRFLPLTHF